MNSCYPSLYSLISGAFRTHLSVCIVTPDLFGPVKNGGIGTACTHLAYALADSGHQVHIFFSQCGYDHTGTSSWLQNYTDRNIKVTIATEWDKNPIAYFPNHPPLYMSKVVYNWMTEQSAFDVVLFMEWQAHGFYALQAKHGGLRFQNTAFITITHSPSVWHSLNNAEISSQPMQSCTWYMERTVLELSDAVISPSAYMLNWLHIHRYRLPSSFVQPNLLILQDHDIKTRIQRPIHEIVFFGRMEYRKGLEQFCRAIDILSKKCHLPQKITFLGKFSWIGDEHSALYIARYALKWKKVKVSILSQYNQIQAMDYLHGAGRLAIMPSVADNSPYTVYECLLTGIPFLARHTGGVAELIHNEDQGICLFGDNPAELANKISSLLGKRQLRVRLSFDPSKNKQAWCNGLPELVYRIRAKHFERNLDRVTPFISVCLTHYNRPNLLKQAVDSLLKQDYSHFEVILADDGSTDADSKSCLKILEPIFRERKWKILRLQNGYLGKARNTASHEARGDYLLFMDDDNVAKPDMLSRFAQAAMYSRADLIVSMFDVFSGESEPCEVTKINEQYLPLGAAVAYATVTNIIGDANSLIRRTIFEQLKGFSEDYGLGHEDFELYLRLVLSGGKVTIIPETTFWYRRTNSSMLRNTHASANTMRSIRPFMDMLPAPLAELALMAHGMANAQVTSSLVNKDDKIIAPMCSMVGDPQSSAILVQVATHLMHRGQKNLAKQLLESLQDSAFQVSIKTSMLCAHARKEASKGNIFCLHECMEAFAKELSTYPDENHAQASSAFYISILDSLPKNKKMHAVCISVLERLKMAEDGSIITSLIISKYSFKIGHINDAVLYFFKALAEAEKKYLEIRIDVENAIHNGKFFCALQHYAFHGIEDNTPWPERYFFSDTLKDHTQLFLMLCDYHMEVYRYTDRHIAQILIGSLQEKIF